MKLKVLTLALIVGSSSIAMADPSIRFQAYGHLSSGSTVRDHRVSSPTIRDHRAPQTRQPIRTHEFPNYRGDWVIDHGYQPRSLVLARSVEFGGLDTRTIYVGEQAGMFTTLRFDAIAGSPAIQQVSIRFDGTTGQAFHNLNVTLRRGQPLVLTLNQARTIQKIVVYAPGYGTAQRQGSDYRASEGVFSVSAY
jgi:hypothetical protein